MTRMKLTLATFALTAALAAATHAPAASDTSPPRLAAICQKEIGRSLGPGPFDAVSVKEWQDNEGNPLDRRPGDTELYLTFLDRSGNPVLDQDMDPPAEFRVQMNSGIYTVNKQGNTIAAEEKKFENLLTRLRQNHGLLIKLNVPTSDGIKLRLFIPGPTSCWQSQTVTLGRNELPANINF